jgi:hypothetical protein
VPSIDGLIGPPELERQPDSSRPLVSIEGWARFEQRARNKRIERRLQAARAAVRAGNLDEANAALEELRELNPQLPEIATLTAAVVAAPAKAARATTRRSSRGGQVAAAAIFAAILFGATTTDLPNWRAPSRATPETPRADLARSDRRDEAAPAVGTALSRPEESIVGAELSPLASDVKGDLARPEDAPAIEATEVVRPVEPAATVENDAARSRPDDPPPIEAELARPVPSAGAELARPTILGPAPFESQPAAVVDNLAPVAAPVGNLPAPPPQVSASASPAASTAASGSRPPAATAAVEDTSGVRAALDRYRTAYERLDASLARTVWPTVNQAALARAFGDLESQSLNFRGCDIQVSGAAATAVCAGSTQYVPKVGSREPRVEPRRWNFTLRKDGAGWLIDSVRAER